MQADTIGTPISREKVLQEFIISRIENNEERGRPISPVFFAEAISEGVSGKVLTRMTKRVPKSLILTTLNTDSSNYSKLVKRKHLTAAQTDDLVDLAQLWHELRTFFVEDAFVKEWLQTPIAVFDGVAPAELMNSQYGRNLVRTRLDEMRFGEFA